MNQLFKKNITLIGWLAGALFIILIAFLFRPNPPAFQLNSVKSLQLMNEPSLAIKVEEMGGKQAIDIRTAELFAKGHVANAINIPVRQLLEPESIELFKELKGRHQTVVLYGSTELQAVSPWLLLQQLGYQNVMRLKGAYTSDNQLTASDLMIVEKAMPDTSVFHSKQAQTDIPEKAKEIKPQVIQVQKRESTKSGGF